MNFVLKCLLFHNVLTVVLVTIAHVTLVIITLGGRGILGVFIVRHIRADCIRPFKLVRWITRKSHCKGVSRLILKQGALLFSKIVQFEWC